MERNAYICGAFEKDKMRVPLKKGDFDCWKDEKDFVRADAGPADWPGCAG